MWGDCVADVAPGSQLLVTLGTSKEAHVFVVPDEAGLELDVSVLPAERTAQKTSGGVLLVMGGAAVIAGAIVLPLYSLSQNVLASGDETAGASVVLIGAGLVVAIVGIVVLVSGSREPRVETTVMYGVGARDGRKDSVLGDVASTTSRDRAPPRPTLTPLGYSFTF